MPAIQPGKLTSPGYGNARLQHISETRIDPDTALEVCYIDYNNILQHTEGWVRKEGGAVLLHLSGANMLRLSEIPGLPNKLLAKVDTSTNNLHV